MTSQVEFFGYNPVGPDPAAILARLNPVSAALERATVVLEDWLKWQHLPDGPYRIELEFGDADVEASPDLGIRVLSRTYDKRDKVTLLELGVPMAMVPANTPRKYLDALRLVLDVTEAVAVAVETAPPRFRPQSHEQSEPHPYPSGEGELSVEEILENLVDDEGSFWVAKQVDTSEPGAKERVEQAERELSELIPPRHHHRIISSDLWDWGVGWEIAGEPLR